MTMKQDESNGCTFVYFSANHTDHFQFQDVKWMAAKRSFEVKMRRVYAKETSFQMKRGRGIYEVPLNSRMR